VIAPAGRTSGSPSGRPAPPRWRTAGLVAGLAGLVAVLVAALLFNSLALDGRGAAAPERSFSPLRGSVVPGFDLAGEWSGEGAVTLCAGLEHCARTRSVTLTIQCAGESCRVTPFDPSWGKPRLEVRDGSYRALGPVPSERAPTCEGVPASSASWHLDLRVLDDRLVGSFEESTLQGFNCGATAVAWNLVLDRA
jgi:hypothetical protein